MASVLVLNMSSLSSTSDQHHHYYSPSASGSALVSYSQQQYSPSMSLPCTPPAYFHHHTRSQSSSATAATTTTAMMTQQQNNSHNNNSINVPNNLASSIKLKSNGDIYHQVPTAAAPFSSTMTGMSYQHHPSIISVTPLNRHQHTHTTTMTHTNSTTHQHTTPSHHQHNHSLDSTLSNVSSVSATSLHSHYSSSVRSSHSQPPSPSPASSPCLSPLLQAHLAYGSQQQQQQQQQAVAPVASSSSLSHLPVVSDPRVLDPERLQALLNVVFHMEQSSGAAQPKYLSQLGILYKSMFPALFVKGMLKDLVDAAVNVGLLKLTGPAGQQQVFITPLARNRQQTLMLGNNNNNNGHLNAALTHSQTLTNQYYNPNHHNAPSPLTASSTPLTLSPCSSPPPPHSIQHQHQYAQKTC